MKISKKNLFTLFVFFTVLTIVLRFSDHPANMTPVGALALMAAWYLPRRWGYVVPLGVMIASDAWMGGYELPVMLSVYGSIAAVTIIGSFLRQRSAIIRCAVGPVLSSTLFFVVTNAAVWAFTPWYAKTIDGLMTSYALALPFWRNMFVGDAVYTGAFLTCVVIVQQMQARQVNQVNPVRIVA